MLSILTRMPPWLLPSILLGLSLFGAGWLARDATLTNVEELEATKAQYEAKLATAEERTRAAVARSAERAALAEEHAARAGEHFAVAVQNRKAADAALDRVASLEGQLAVPVDPVVLEKTPQAVRDRLALLQGALTGYRGRVESLEGVVAAQGAVNGELESALNAMREARDWQIEATEAAEAGKAIAEARVLEYEQAVQSKLRTVVGATGGRSFGTDAAWWWGVGITFGWTVR